MVDFIAASPLRYALTVKPTVFVSNIRQFWSTVRIETTDKGTHILATVDGIQRTVSEASLRRNLKLRDEDDVVSIPDTELFENLTLMWFNEFSSNIATALVCLATNMTYNFSKMIFDGMVKNANNKGEGSGTPTEPHHTPFPEVESSHPTTSLIPLPSIPTAPIPTINQPDRTPIIQYSRRARIAQSPTLPTVADEPASPVRDVSEGEACPTTSGFIADQDRATIAKSSALTHNSTPRVTSPAADEGSMQQNISELTALCTSLQRQYSELMSKLQAQEEEIGRLKEWVQALEDRKGVASKQSREDAPIKGRREIDVPTSSGFIPTAGPIATIISTGSEVGPTASPIVTRRKGKEVMVEFDTPKKKKLQEQIDAQVARELEEQQEREDIRMNEQIARDAEVARIHAEEEIQGMIDSLDKSNETIAKYLKEYQEFASELPLEKKIELISDLVKYQEH
nr:hypothetical protein [Tanacetum cinerariifolium]